MLLKESMVDYNTFPYFHLFSIIFKKLEAENKIPRVCIVVHSYTANIVPLVSGYCLESKQKIKFNAIHFDKKLYGFRIKVLKTVNMK